MVTAQAEVWENADGLAQLVVVEVRVEFHRLLDARVTAELLRSLGV